MESSEPGIVQSPSEEATLNNRGYRLIRKLGEGSYAKVYLGEFRSEKESDKRYKLACKIVDTSRAPKDFVKKFLPRELDILIKLNHPHIVHVHSIFQRRAKYYIFMRYSENGDLLEFVLKNGSITENQSRVWMRQLGLAIQYLHELEIAHRDLKCENVLLTANYNVKLADFGFARYVVDAKRAPVLSETYCGSLSYAAPEILKGKPYSPKIADIWSLGVICYIMLNKAMPFDDTNIKRLYEQQTTRRWKFRARVIDLLSDQVKKLVAKMLEPDPAYRHKIEHVIKSNWIAMDNRLTALSAAESTALAKATEERKRLILSVTDKKQPKPIPKPKPKKPNANKQTSTALDVAQEVSILKEMGTPVFDNADSIKYD